MTEARKPLWPKPIPIIGGTGEFESGKTLFGLTIDPGPRTLVYDIEKSSESYVELGFERIDVLKVMQEKYPNGYKPVDLFLWWREHVKQIQAGKYTVIMVDPVTDLERGMTDWVSANPHVFGHTPSQYAKMSGIMWGDLKDYMKSILGDIATRCETFYYTAHVGREFEGNEATKRLKVKGKATLSELASLFLWFERKPNSDGVKPDAPSAFVRKTRLLYSKMVDGEMEMHKILPDRLPVATPKTVRGYFVNPAGGRAAEDGEQSKEEGLTEDEKMLIQMRTAEAQRDVVLARSNAAVTSGVPTTPAAQAPATSTPPVEVSLYKTLSDSIASAADLDQLKTVAGKMNAEVKSLNKTQISTLAKQLGDRKAELSKSVPAASAPAPDAAAVAVQANAD